MNLKSQIKKALYNVGFKVSRVTDENKFGGDPYRDMSLLTGSGVRPIMFDAGAHTGESIEMFRRYFASPVIHSFEPSHATFQVLKSRTEGVSDLHLNNVALGSHRGRRLFVESDHSSMSSLLEPGKDCCWGTVIDRHEVEVDTIDTYCNRASITHIDILKSDTQGFDYQVLRGARDMLSRHRIHLVYIEIIFAEMYEELPRFDEIYRFLSEQGLFLVSFYTMHYQNNRASWTDALFVDPVYRGSLDRALDNIPRDRWADEEAAQLSVESGRPSRTHLSGCSPTAAKFTS